MTTPQSSPDCAHALTPFFRRLGIPTEDVVANDVLESEGLADAFRVASKQFASRFSSEDLARRTCGALITVWGIRGLLSHLRGSVRESARNAGGAVRQSVLFQLVRTEGELEAAEALLAEIVEDASRPSEQIGHLASSAEKAVSVLGERVLALGASLHEEAGALTIKGSAPLVGIPAFLNGVDALRRRAGFFGSSLSSTEEVCKSLGI